jgi:hypothetical protein
MSPTRWYAALPLLFAFAGMASPAHSRQPAYRLTNVAFQTSLHGVRKKLNAPVCKDDLCAKVRGVLVAEGASKAQHSGITIQIREFHTNGANSQKLLQKLASSRLGKDKKVKQVRMITGKVNGFHVAEQWTTTDHCERVLQGRVFLAFEKKVIEIETSAALVPGTKQTKTTIQRMNQILHGMRIRRIGNFSPDPAKEPIPAKQVSVAKVPVKC